MIGARATMIAVAPAVAMRAGKCAVSTVAAHLKMTPCQQQVIVFPGTFDPITNGHMDVIRRAAKIFGGLIVAVGRNPQKQTMFSIEQRAEMVRKAAADITGVRVETYTGLTAEAVRRMGATAILRGLRDPSDLHSEFQMSQTNRTVGGVETIFMMTGGEFSYISSALIRQIASMGGDVSAMVPPPVVECVRSTPGK